MWDRTFTIDTWHGRLVLGVFPSRANISSSLPLAAVRDAVDAEWLAGRLLLDWYRQRQIVWSFKDDAELLAELYRDLADGSLSVREEEIVRAPLPRSAAPNTGGLRRREALEPIPLEPIEDSNKSLLITECPAMFDPRSEPLRVKYLQRELTGQPLRVVIRSKDNPEPPVHQRLLDADKSNDGLVFEWNGVADVTGKFVERPEAPFTIELIYDDAYRDSAATTLPPPPRAHFLELEDLLFATDRSVLLPDSLGALIVILEFASEHPNKRMLVAGHTDTAGSDAHNQALSGLRAENVRLWLVGDAEGWAAHCQANFEIADFKAIHAWAHRHLGWSTEPGELDNEWHNKARAARDVFRSECEALLGVELEHHVAQNPADWLAIHDLYSLLVSRYLELDPPDLLELRRALGFCAPPTLGCGENFPRDRPGQDGIASAINRRVDVLFFDPAEQPDISAEPTGTKIYGEKMFDLHELEPKDLDPLTPAIFEILIKLYDHWLRAPLGDTAYVLSGPLPERLFQREGSTDADGLMHEELLPSGHYDLRVGESSVIVISHPVGFSDPDHPQVGPKFPDVYRVPGYGFNPVFPAGAEDGAGDWVVPTYVPGPDHEVVIDDDVPDELDDEDEETNDG